MIIGGAKQKGIIDHGISANRQNPFAGAAHDAIFNTFRRTKGQIFYWLPPMLAGYYLLNWATERYDCRIANEEKLDLIVETETTTSTPRLAVLSLPTPRKSKMVHKVTCVGLWASGGPSVYQRLDQVKKNRNGWLYE